MRRIALIFSFLISLNSYAQVTWLEAKDSMGCSVEDATISHLSNYLMKKKISTAVDVLFEKIGIKYHSDSLEIHEESSTSSHDEKESYISGTLLTKKGSLIKLSDSKNSTDMSGLRVDLTTRETVKYEYDSEGIPTLRVWLCTATISSNDLVVQLINQSQNDYAVGSMKIRFNEVYKFEKVEKL